MSVEYLIKQYGLQQGALEIQYIEEFFLDFPRKKTATEVIQRLANRDHQILMAEAALPEEPGTFVPVSFKVSHELRAQETDPKLADLVAQLEDCVEFNGRRVLYQWIGGTRSDWRGQGHFRALTEEQEVWAMDNGFDEIIVKTKNRFYEMRSTLAQLHFDIIRFVQHPVDPGESKVFFSKRLGQHVIDSHRSRRSVVRTDRVIERIESADDPRLDPYRHVGDPHWMRERGLFVAEGRLVVERLLALGRFAVQSILVNRAAHAAMRERCCRAVDDRCSSATTRRCSRDHRLQLSSRLPGAGRASARRCRRPRCSTPGACCARRGRQSRQRRRPVPHRGGASASMACCSTPRAAIRSIARRSARRWARRSACRSRGPSTGCAALRATSRARLHVSSR